MAVSTSTVSKTLHSGPPCTAPQGKFTPKPAGDGEKQLRRQQVISPETYATPEGSASPSGAASPFVYPYGGASPFSAATPPSPEIASPAPELADELAGEAAEPVVRVVRQTKPRSRAFEFCIFLVSSAIILIFIALLLFVLAFDREVITIIDKGIKRPPKLRDLYCNTKLCKSFTREVISFVNFSRDPCNELLEYVCEGYESEESINHIKWSAPGMDYARFTKVLDGIYRRNVSDGPVWDRKFVAGDLWELASPLYERCLIGDGAPAPMPHTLADYLTNMDLNFTEDITEIYKMVPLFHHVFTTAYPWKDDNRTAPSLVLGRERSLLPAGFASTRAGRDFMADFIKDILTGVSPQLRISDGVAAAVADVERVLGQVSIPKLLVEPFVSTRVRRIVNDTVSQQIASFIEYNPAYKDWEGKIRIMYADVLKTGSLIDQASELFLVETMAAGLCSQQVGRYNLPRLHQWFHLAARVALATGIEPSASAVLTLMSGILGKTHAERRCLTLFDTEARPFAFDRVRAMLHTDEAAVRGKELYAKFLEYSKMFFRSASFGGDALQEYLADMMDELRVLFMYPFSNMTDEEVGQYPLSRLAYPEVTVMQNASFWEHLALIKKAIWDRGMQDHRYAHNLTWMHFSTLEQQPRLSVYLRALYVPAIFYQRIWSMTDPNEKEAIPLDLPIFWYPVLRQVSTLLSEKLGTRTLGGLTGTSLSFDYDRIWSGNEGCFLSLLYALGYAPQIDDVYHAPSEGPLVEFLYNLFMSKTESWRLKEKPTAEKVFLYDYPDITLDKLFVIALGSNFCRKEDDDVKKFQSQRTNTGMSRKDRLVYTMRFWPKFREIFNCSATDLYAEAPTMQCFGEASRPPMLVTPSVR